MKRPCSNCKTTRECYGKSVSCPAVWLFVIFLLAFVAATCRADESVYIPTCLEKRCKPRPNNTVELITGPTTLRSPEGRMETLMGAGYYRRLKDDLSVGGLILWTDRRFLGGAVGVQYHW
jgi:hypothetical protein